MIVYVCGAGGKTTYIKRRARAAANAGLSVLITTTTHMRREPEVILNPKEALAAKRNGGIVFAGAPDPKNSGKIIGFPEAEAEELRRSFDLVLVEADGARSRQVKLPYAHEPVIGADADEIIVISGSRAAGMTISEAAYNVEGISALIGKGPDEILLEEDVERIVREGYLEPLSRCFPDADVRHVKGCSRHFHLILLAAGYSSRFGSNKLLYVINGKEMYRHTADHLLELSEEYADKMDLTVVTQYQEIERNFNEKKAEVAVNPDPSRGISSSLQCAVTSLEERGLIGGDDFLVFFSGDQPLLQKKTTEAFLRGLDESGLRLGAVTDGIEMRNPCAFAAEYIPELMSLTGDRGGKKVLKQHPGEIFLFSVERKEELEDMDVLC